MQKLYERQKIIFGEYYISLWSG